MHGPCFETYILLNLWGQTWTPVSDEHNVYFNTITDHLSHDRLSEAVRCAVEDLGIQHLLRVLSHATV
jgi:hypothetical protein